METLQNTGRTGYFSASALKLIACICMTVDHVGAYLLPQFIWLRLVGRVAFPIFAYFIAEGCAYTRNKPKRLITIGLLGAACEAVYILYTRKLYGNILITFTLSIILIYCLQWVKCVFSGTQALKKAAAAAVFVASLLIVYRLSAILSVDYGFFGVLVPVFASVFSGKENRDAQFIAFCAGLALLIIKFGVGNIQVWSLFSLPFIAMYNGEAGVKKFKYGFYAFYPIHLLVIWTIGRLIQNV